MGSIRKVELWFLGDRGFPHAKVSLPEELTGNLPELLAAVRRLQPSFDLDALVRAVWHFGVRGVRHRQERRIPIKLPAAGQ